MTEIYKLAYTYLANTQINIELIDKLRDTKFGNNKKRKKYNSIQIDNIEIIDKLHKDFPTDQQLDINKMIEAIEIMIEAITSGELEIFTSLMREYKAGNIKFEGDKTLPSFDDICKKHDLTGSGGRDSHPDACYFEGAEDMYEAIKNN